MNESPTLDQLRELFRSFDERSGHPHVLWVSQTGDVRISADQGGTESPPITDASLRYEMFSPQSDQVGPGAATDPDFMNRLFKSLQQQWGDAQGAGNKMVYVDRF